MSAPERMTQLQHLQSKLFEEHFKRCDERMKKLAQDEVRSKDDKSYEFSDFSTQDHDEEAIEQLREEAEADTDVIGRLSDVWHALFAKVRDCVTLKSGSSLTAVWRVSAATVRATIAEYDANV